MLVKKGFFSSREKARRAILAGQVRVDGQLVQKAGWQVKGEPKIEVESSAPFVSRGGRKLIHALDYFQIEVEGKVCLDAGVGTGGFTDCLLKRGADLVIAVDVGYGQVAWSLRNHPRVFLLERRNIRYLKNEEIPKRPDFVVGDLSFISIKKVFLNLRSLAKPSAHFLFLVKPQFEVGKGKVGKGGIVKDPNLHHEVLTDMTNYFSQQGYQVALTYSPLKGRDGNIEFFAYLLPSSEPGLAFEEIDEVIAEAHQKARLEG
jgi:23S rRNA (cytidine1920-2'-O)/16S rRNA (cytidine1409-2'-O)-methyltransferase